VITVVKAGGAAKDVGAKIAALVTAGRPVVVVHGAGPQISERCRAVGIEPRFVDGLRVTDAGVLAVVEQALNHQNAVLVSELEAAGVAAVSVLDALHGTPDCDRRLGLVGRVSSVVTEHITAVLASGQTPVVRPMASGLNVNADHAAAAVARALGAGELIFLSDVPGVLDGSGAVIRRISAGQAPALIAGGHVCGGMIPKLESGLEAIAHGVWRVWIGAETMVTA
jgi:acetylglutamate kinase